jgi:hypothetical protein
MIRTTIVPLLGFIAMMAVISCRSEGLCSKHGVKAEVEGVHYHRLSIPAAAIERGEGGTYRIEGAEHEHAVRFSADDFKKLAKGEKVEVRTTSVEAHVHNVIVQCRE